jgi:hypothetical protein
MSVLESFDQLKDQVVKADGEIMAVAEKDEPAIQAKVDDARQQADRQAGELKATTSAGNGAQGHWQEIQTDWQRHRERMRGRLADAKAGYDLGVVEDEAESAETDALDAIAFAASAVLEAQYATLDAVLARRRATAEAAASS